MLVAEGYHDPDALGVAGHRRKHERRDAHVRGRAHLRLWVVRQEQLHDLGVAVVRGNHRRGAALVRHGRQLRERAVREQQPHTLCVAIQRGAHQGRVAVPARRRDLHLGVVRQQELDARGTALLQRCGINTYVYRGLPGGSCVAR